MRTLQTDIIRDAVADMVVSAALKLRPDVLRALEGAVKQERNKRPRNALKVIVENASAAWKNKIPLCQDTGMTVVFCEIGRDLYVSGNLDKAINDGVKKGTRKGCLRRSIVSEPLGRANTGTNTPVIIHYSFCRGSRMRLSLLLKGFGCENKGKVVMLNPTASREEIEAFIITAIQEAGANACPPFVVGIGMGGTMDKACELAKKALLVPIGKRNACREYALLEKRLVKKANATGIGPLGLGGRTTVLDIKVLPHATHIAGLPVAVNISCHALRSKKVVS